MNEDPALIQKREELKHQIAAGEYLTLVSIITNGPGRLVQKFSRNSEPLTFWYGPVVMALVTLLIAFWTSILLGEFSPLRRRAIPGDIAVVILTLAAVIFGNIYRGVFLRPGLITSWMLLNQSQI